MHKFTSLPSPKYSKVALITAGVLVGLLLLRAGMKWFREDCIVKADRVAVRLKFLDAFMFCGGLAGLLEAIHLIALEWMKKRGFAHLAETLNGLLFDLFILDLGALILSPFVRKVFIRIEVTCAKRWIQKKFPILSAEIRSRPYRPEHIDSVKSALHSLGLTNEATVVQKVASSMSSERELWQTVYKRLFAIIRRFRERINNT